MAYSYLRKLDAKSGTHELLLSIIILVVWTLTQTIGITWFLRAVVSFVNGNWQFTGNYFEKTVSDSRQL